MARLHDRSKLLQILSETPIVTLACKKVGLNPCTYYRWYNSDRDFRKQADEILSVGRMTINDMAEGSIIKEIKNGNMRANIFWLQHNDSRYRPVRTAYVEPIVHKHELKPGEVCTTCGYSEPEIDKDTYVDKEKIAQELYRKLKIAKHNRQTPEQIKKIIEEIAEKLKNDGPSGCFKIIFDDGRKRSEKSESNDEEDDKQS